MSAFGQEEAFATDFSPLLHTWRIRRSSHVHAAFRAARLSLSLQQGGDEAQSWKIH